MSHFTILVVGDDVEGQLAKYDENLEMPRYVDPDFDAEKTLTDARDALRKYSEDPKLETQDVDPANEAAVFQWWQSETPDWEDGKWVGYSTYNPESKWDWYQIGGRWADGLKIKASDGKRTGSTATVGTLSGDTHPTYALVIDGEWFAKGRMGWFGMSNDPGNDAAWWSEFWGRLAKLDPSLPVTLVDAHI